MKDYESETQSAKCPHGPREDWPPCSECSEPTPYACSDCAINGKTVAVCYRDACQNKHEANHPGVFCKSCGYAHTDPRLRNPESEVSINFNGQRLVCETYARWIAEAILEGRDVVLFQLGSGAEQVKIMGVRQ